MLLISVGQVKAIHVTEGVSLRELSFTSQHAWGCGFGTEQGVESRMCRALPAGALLLEVWHPGM